MTNKDTSRESKQTIATVVFMACAGLMALCAVAFRPAPYVQTVEGVGDRVFPDFGDPSEIASLEIVHIDKQQRKRLKIVNRAGLWVLESHKNYPADAKDAKERINQAAFALMELTIVKPATKMAAEHELFGVLNPGDDDALDSDGAGMLVVVENIEGKKRAELIIGKQVKNKRAQRVVRRPGQNLAYVVNIDPKKLSSKFSDWIEGNLLGIKSNDVQRLSFLDYSCVLTQQQEVVEGQAAMVERFSKFVQHAELVVDWNLESYEWELNKYNEFKDSQPVPAQLGFDQALDNKKLDNFRAALGSLRILDAQAKPKSLKPDLRVDEALTNDQDAMASLSQRGFYPVGNTDGSLMLAKEGEIYIDTYDYVRYALKFGKSVNSETDDGEIQLNRYLLVSVFPDVQRIPKPELREVPEPEEADEAEAPKEDEEKEQDEAADEDEPEVDEAEKERQRIIKSNERKEKEYLDKVEAAKTKASKANQRMGNWYYVISEGIYRELNLSRVDLITQASIDQGFSIEAFRKLESDGLPKRKQ